MRHPKRYLSPGSTCHKHYATGNTNEEKEMVEVLQTFEEF